MRPESPDGALNSRGSFRGQILRAGFSLVELLVVLALIALLAALLWPVLTSARKAAQRTTCTSKLRQLWMAYQMYVADHGSYPRPLSLARSSYVKSWSLTLCPQKPGIPGRIPGYMFTYWVPPDFAKLAGRPEVHPSTVLVACDNHLAQRIIPLKNDGMILSPPDYPYHLVLRASGAVEKVHVSRVKRATLPGDLPLKLNVYPGEPGYDDLPNK